MFEGYEQKTIQRTIPLKEIQFTSVVITVRHTYGAYLTKALSATDPFQMQIYSHELTQINLK